MKKQAQRIAIAEMLGAKWYSYFFMGPDYLELAFEKPNRGKYSEAVGVVVVGALKKGRFMLRVPDYPNSLEGMNVAESALTPDQGIAFARHLEDVCQRDLCAAEPCQGGFGHWLPFMVCHAAANQRAEALLKTLGKWTEPN